MSATVNTRTKLGGWLGLLAGLPRRAAYLFYCGVLAAVAQGANVYVVPAGSAPTPPYNDWSIAATNIQTAVDYACTNYPAYDTVVVSNGTYSVTNQILVTNAIAVRSLLGGLAGASNTVVQATGSANPRRVFKLNHAGASLRGLTIRNGYIAASAEYGAGVHMTGGWVGDCIISNNTTSIHNDGGAGAGIYMVGGIVTNCLVVNNTAGGNGSPGVGICLTTGALATHCIVQGNFWGNGQSSYGAGVYVASGCTLRNCLVTLNTMGVNASGGGGVGGPAGGIVESCTVVSNKTNSGSGGGIYGCTVTNSIVWGNIGSVGTIDNYAGSPAFAYSCTTPLPAGAGNTNADPAFVDAPAGDYRLLPASPCRDTGLLQGWMTGAVDLDGNGRVYNTVPDMGAYESTPGALVADFSADVLLGVEPLSAILTASVSGTNTTSLYYKWDLDNNGSYDVQGADKAVITNAFSAGSHSIKLEVNNGAAETAISLRTDYIVATKSTIYVAAGNAGAAVPYMDWATAAATIGNALGVASDGTSVLVSNGTYNITAPLEIDNAIVLRSVNGAATTIVNRASGSLRIVRMQNAGAVLDGFTIRGGNLAGDGSGIHMTGGLVRNCVITNNVTTTHGTSYGSGVYMDGGVLSNCLVIANGSGYNSSHGGGIHLRNGALATRCTITGNFQSGGNFSSSGGVHMNGTDCLLRNCLVYGNTAGIFSGGGVNGGVVESCTIVTNTAGGSGGGTLNAAVTNSIVYFNAAASGVNFSGGSFAYSCTTPLPAGAGNIDADPMFAGAATNNFRLQVKPTPSPCIDKGTELAWMASGQDLAGTTRILNRGVDMGAYENFIRAAGTVILLR